MPRCAAVALAGARLRKTPPMRAIVLTSFSGLDALELSEAADPTPGDGEELVRVRAAALGPWDISGANGAFASIGGSSEFPQVQGWDFAGEAGDGRRVLGFVPQPWMGVGTFAEQIAVPSALLAPLPDALSFAEGGALPVCALAARLLVEAAGVAEGHVVLVTGAAGMVGGFAMQLARARGGRVVAAVRERDADEASALGADSVVSTGDDLEVEVRGQWQDGVDACVDTIGLGAAGLVCVRDGGHSSPRSPPRCPTARAASSPRRSRSSPTRQRPPNWLSALPPGS